MSLTTRQIETAKPGPKDYKLADRDGLYLHVRTTGTKTWRHNFTRAGKQQTRTYGRFPAMPLAEARDAHRDATQPTSDAAPAAPVSAVPTFGDVAGQWMKKHLPTLKNPKHRQQYEATLERWVMPTLRNRPIDTIKRTELVTLVEAIQKDEAKGKADDRVETAHRVAGRITAVFNHAQDRGVLEAHPAANLTRVLKSRKVKKPMACVAPSGAGSLLVAIDSYADGNNEGEMTRFALQFMAMTFGRVNEIRMMQWDQLEDDGWVWVAPAEIVKGGEETGTPHVVPLSRQARDLLEQVRRFTGDSKYVFESSARPGHPMSENTLLFALYRLGYRDRMTVHGFRSLFSTVCNELAPQEIFRDADKRDVIEKQLNHSETNEVRAAYNRAMYLPTRRALMQWYSDWLDQQRADRLRASDRLAPAADTSLPSLA